MKAMLSKLKGIMDKIKRKLAQRAGRKPSPLPVGMEEFDKWAKDIADTYDLATKDDASIKFALASVIMHTKPDEYAVPKAYFAAVINTAAAKQIAHYQFAKIKNEQEANKAAEAAKQQPAEATAKLTVVADGPQQ